jgi:hypothetical protein
LCQQEKPAAEDEVKESLTDNQEHGIGESNVNSVEQVTEEVSSFLSYY